MVKPLLHLARALLASWRPPFAGGTTDLSPPVAVVVSARLPGQA